MNADQRADRMFWLLLIGLGIAIVWIACRFPRFSLAVIAALGNPWMVNIDAEYHEPAP
jgi:hypothetical protein